MRYVIIIYFIVLVVNVALLWEWKRKVVECGSLFCQLVDELESAFRKAEKIRNDENICNVEQAIIEQHIKMLYNPERMDLYYAQFELFCIEIFDIYDSIERQEKHFRSDDWERVEEAKDSLDQLFQHIRYEEWRRSYRKV